MIVYDRFKASSVTTKEESFRYKINNVYKTPYLTSH